LKCYKRSGTESVPGCSAATDLSKNYCYVPPAGQLVRAGDNGYPPSAFPLKKCQSDCDSDSDCASGLVCKQRAGNEPVPGCSGNATDYSDYCIVPEVIQSETLGLCRGDCDSDSECDKGLICLQRDSGQPVPGCKNLDLNNANDYCVLPYIKDYGSTPSSSRFPLKRCEGDCDTNSQCASGLYCFQRSAGVAVPGCFGGETAGSDSDFCTSVFAKCQGSCNSDLDCDWGLKCYKRSGTESVPGCSAATDLSKNYCYVPPIGQLVRAGDNGYPASAFPLKKCQSDCDSDSDCASGLVCKQRAGNEPVSGCSGNATAYSDYCVV